MPKKLSLLLTLAVAVPASPARAEAEFVGGEVVVFGMVIEGSVSVAALVTIIGSAAQLRAEGPSGLGWPIASMVTGGLATAWGGLFTLVAVTSGTSPADSPGLYAFSLPPLILGLSSLGLGIAGFVKRHRVQQLERMEIEDGEEMEDDDWVVAPIMLDTREGAAPGLGASVRF